MPLVVADRAPADALVGGKEIAEILRVQTFGQLSRADDVTEEHRELPPLAMRGWIDIEAAGGAHLQAMRYGSSTLPALLDRVHALKPGRNVRSASTPTRHIASVLASLLPNPCAREGSVRGLTVRRWSGTTSKCLASNRDLVAGTPKPPRRARATRRGLPRHLSGPTVSFEMSDTPPRVVIVGGGFGGLNAARELARARVEITLVDRRNHHLFQPLLYQVATAALNPSDIATPIRRVLRNQKNVEVLLAEARAIDLSARSILLDEGSVPYDYLIVATGATHSYFGRESWTPFAPGLKTIGDALEIRRRVLSAFEFAEREKDQAQREAWLTFVIVGAGPTGVELSGALCEIAQHALARDFRHINLLGAGAGHLARGIGSRPSPYIPALSEKGAQQLVRLGVDVRTGAEGHVDRRGRRGRRQRTDLDAHRALGRWGRGLRVRARARRASRPGRPGSRGGRSVDRRAPRGLRGR